MIPLNVPFEIVFPAICCAIDPAPYCGALVHFTAKLMNAILVALKVLSSRKAFPASFDWTTMILLMNVVAMSERVVVSGCCVMSGTFLTWWSLCDLQFELFQGFGNER